MAAITQPRSFSPLTGGRYGSFDGKGTAAVPDFMHGTLDVYLYVTGEVKLSSHVSGEISCRSYVSGGVEVNP